MNRHVKTSENMSLVRAMPRAGSRYLNCRLYSGVMPMLCASLNAECRKGIRLPRLELNAEYALQVKNQELQSFAKKKSKRIICPVPPKCRKKIMMQKKEPKSKRESNQA